MLLMSLFALFTAANVFAQGGGISGVVKDAQGVIIGASVIIDGTNTGTTSGLDGTFSLPSAKEGDVISVSYLGYETQRFTCNGQKFFEITLVYNTENLDALVVTALGIKRQEKALSYNVQQVQSEAVTTVKDANFMNSLVGKVAGVTINAGANGAGGAARVVMRGTKSLEKDDNALYVIDGIPMFNLASGNSDGGTILASPGTNGVADINPEDIESMTILTGPSAAALYGSDAANGVVLITTKRGIDGGIRVTYNNSTSFSDPLIMPRFQNTYGNDLGDAYSWGGKLANPSTYNPADFFNTGLTEINSLTLTGGTEKNQLYASVSTTNTSNILPNSSYNRYNFSVRNVTKLANDKLTVDVGAQYVLQDHRNMVGSGRYYNPLPALYLFPRGEDFKDVQLFERWNESRKLNEQYWPSSKYATTFDMQNPYWIMYRMLNESEKQRYIFNASVKWDIASWINLTGRVRMDNLSLDQYRKLYASTNTTFTEGSDKGLYEQAKQTDRSVYGDLILSINKSFYDRLTLNANIGGSINDQRENMLRLTGGLAKVPNFFSITNIDIAASKRNTSRWHDQTQSVFASVELGWDYWLYLTVTGRNDWSSQLAFTSKNSYFYPSAGLSIVFNELLNLPEAISLLKIRGSWAEVASAPARYLTQMQYAYNEGRDEFEFPSDHYNTDLRPENTRSWEVGLNARFFRNHLNLDATWYRSNTFNQTFRVQASPSSGYENNIVQTGNIQNEGLELSVGYNNTWNNWSFATNFTYTMNRNKIINLANGAVNPATGEKIEMDYYSMGTLGMDGGPVMRLTEGGSMGDIYTNKMFRQDVRGRFVYDLDGNPILDNAEYRKLGSTLPKGNMGWTTAVGYAGLNLSWTFAARFGGIVVSDTQAVMDQFGVSQTTAIARDNGMITMPDGSTVSPKAYYSVISTAPGAFYLYDGTNVRLADVSLSYTLPKKWFRNKMGMTVGLTGKNLLLIYCKAPFDPEVTSSTSSNFYQGVDFFQLPSLRSYGFNVKLQF